MKCCWVTLLCLCLSVIEVVAAAPEGDTLAVPKKKIGLLRRIIRGFDRLDTAYIEPQHYTFTAMLQSTNTYDRYTLRSGGGQQITLSPDIRPKIGPYLGWRWVFVGYTFDVGRINLSKHRQEFDLSLYSSQIGVDLFYRRTGSDYKLRSLRLGPHIDTTPLEGMPFDGIKVGIRGFNLYYIFNHGRFSYPAAFSQSTVQKRSCGSWMVGIGHTRNSLELDHQKLQATINRALSPQEVALDSGLTFHRVKYTDINISAGYGYNWVFAPRWLLAASLQGAVAYKQSEGFGRLTNFNFSFKNINFDGIGRLGLVYNNMRWYAGMSLIMRTYNYHKSRFSTNNTFGSLNIYAGYNFALRKKYRAKK